MEDELKLPETPETIGINVADDVTSQDVGPGQQTMDDHMARYHEETMALLKHYVAPHRKRSRWVTEEDIDKVIEDGKIMVNLCHTRRGVYQGSAIAHTQINDTDPLRFFVLASGAVVINPVMVDHTKTPVFKDQGCMSYPEEPLRTIATFHKVTVRFQTVAKRQNPETGEEKIVFSPFTEQGFSGAVAEVMVHEISHLNGWNIYDEGYSAGTAVEPTPEELNIVYAKADK